jgi:glycosyltransferase involved in cell wall biosynthesis
MHTNKSPLVSIIMPAYNYASFIAEAVASVLQQTHSNIEVIIVDDGSTDDTADVAAMLVKHDARVAYVHQNNQGPSAARNTGIQKSKGEFILFLDADDTFHPQKIQAHLEHFLQAPDVDISYGCSRYFLSGKPEEIFSSIALDNENWMPCVSGNAIAVMPALVVNNIMPICSAMLRRSVVERVRGFDSTLKWVEDWDYWLRASAAGCRFEFSDDERLAAFIRVHDISLSKNSSGMLISQYRLRLQNIPQCVKTIPDEAVRAATLRDNTKRRLRCLVTIAGQTGVCNREFFQLCRGESPVILLKMLYRLLRAHRARRNT